MNNDSLKTYAINTETFCRKGLIFITINDVERIEKALEIKLPDELKQKYISTELDELDNVENLGLDEYINKPNQLKNYLIRDPEKILNINLRVRKKGLFKKEFNHAHFIIGYTWNTDYYLINLQDSKVTVYSVKYNKTWEYNPDDLSKNTLMRPEHTLDDYLDAYPLNYLNMAKEDKNMKESGISPRKITAEDVYDFLDKLRKGENVDEYIGNKKNK